MTLHLVRRPLEARALACVGSSDIIVLVGAGGDTRPPAGARCERAGGADATLDDAALVALILEAERVVAW